MFQQVLLSVQDLYVLAVIFKLISAPVYYELLNKTGCQIHFPCLENSVSSYFSKLNFIFKKSGHLRDIDVNTTFSKSEASE